MAVGYVYDDIYLRHDTGDHPENARRLTAIMDYLKETGILSKLSPIKPLPATTKELLAVHSEEHILRIKAASEHGEKYLDADTVISPHSYESALYAAGGAIKATEAVMEGEVSSAFALVRPPGHHATRHESMGFCLFNNIAIAATYALSQYKLERIAIIDTDVHHGNGTQDSFYGNPHVIYVSTHESPLYPGTGSIEETGTGEALGTKINIPLPAGSGDSEYRRVYEEIVIPVVHRFKPQLIMVSAGYDAHWRDELAMLKLSVSGYGELMQNIKNMAETLCDGRMVLSLEGGYNLEALSASVKATFDVLLGNTAIEDPVGKPPGYKSSDISQLILALKKTHHLR